MFTNLNYCQHLVNNQQQIYPGNQHIIFKDLSFKGREGVIYGNLTNVILYHYCCCYVISPVTRHVYLFIAHMDYTRSTTTGCSTFSEAELSNTEVNEILRVRYSCDAVVVVVAVFVRGLQPRTSFVCSGRHVSDFHRKHVGRPRTFAAKTFKFRWYPYHK